MLRAILGAATAICAAVAAVFFWMLANKYGAGISFKKFVLILLGLALMLLAIGWL